MLQVTTFYHSHGLDQEKLAASSKRPAASHDSLLPDSASGEGDKNVRALFGAGSKHAKKHDVACKVLRCNNIVNHTVLRSTVALRNAIILSSLVTSLDFKLFLKFKNVLRYPQCY